MSYDVFISFKNSGKDGNATPDATAARGVYDALKSAGMKVFFSEESLAEVGKGQFGKSIETALESARVLILVASCREHIESPWVETEWDSFLQTVRSGHKQGELFIFNCGDLKPSDLPLFLRRQQMFTKNSMEKLLQFVASAVPALPTLGDFIQVALHCLRPEKNEDKVYLVTVHPGNSASTCHVTAHWGARSAKRLSSQMKAINVSKELATTEVEKAKQEKLRGGYLPAAYAKLLTDEARSHLSASLGLFEVEQAPKAKAKAKAKAKGKSQPKVKPDASKVIPTKVQEPKPIVSLKKPTTVVPKPAAKTVPKPNKREVPGEVSVTKKALSKAPVKPVLAKAPSALSKLPEKKSVVKKVAVAPIKQAAKVLATEIKKASMKVAKNTAQKTAPKKVAKDAAIAPLKSAGKKAVKTATTSTTSTKTPSRRR